MPPIQVGRQSLPSASTTVRDSQALWLRLGEPPALSRLAKGKDHRRPT